MQYVLSAILGYLCLNYGMWLSTRVPAGALVVAVGCCTGGFVMAGVFRRAIQQQKARPRGVAITFGALGITCVVIGLRASHSHLPPSLAMESVYNLWAVLSWPLFVGLHYAVPREFQERPSRFDLGCHAAMFVLVVVRFYTYPNHIHLTWGMVWSVGLAVIGYAALNLGSKLAQGKVITTVITNTVGLLIPMAIAINDGALQRWQWSWAVASTLALTAIAILLIVSSLRLAYTVMKPSLVPPMVYDGILITNPVLAPLTHEPLSLGAILLAAAMCGIAGVRYRHHHQKD